MTETNGSSSGTQVMTPQDALRRYAEETEQIAELLQSQEHAAEVLQQSQKKAAEELLAAQTAAAQEVSEARSLSLGDLPESYRAELEAAFQASSEALKASEARIAGLLVEAQREAAALLLASTMKVRDRWQSEAEQRKGGSKPGGPPAG